MVGHLEDERLARATTYYTQGGNANVLYSNYFSNGKMKEEAADQRTCNLTVVGMMLEGLGKGPESYAPSKTPAGAAALNAITTYFYNQKRLPSPDYTTLRMPDFMQVALLHQTLFARKIIHARGADGSELLESKSGLGLSPEIVAGLVARKDTEPLYKVVEKARWHAAHIILDSASFGPVLDAFQTRYRRVAFAQPLYDKVSQYGTQAKGTFRDIIDARQSIRRTNLLGRMSIDGLEWSVQIGTREGLAFS